MPIPGLSLGCVVSLINEWGTIPQRVTMHPWGGFPDADAPDRLRLAREWGKPVPSDATVRTAADALYPVFNTGDAGERVRLLNDWIRRTVLAPRLCADAGGGRLGWDVAQDADRLFGAMIVPLLDAVGGDRPVRLGVCADERCADVFADSSPRQNREYCSTRCQTRHRVREHRARRSQGQE